MTSLPLPNTAAQEMLGYLGSIFKLEDELIAGLQPMLRYEKIKRKTHLLRPGQVNDRLYYIHKGLLRCYYLKQNEDGEGPDIEVSTWFMRERDTCVSILSYYLQQPSFEYIEAMEHCELFSIGFTELEAIYQRSFSFNFIGRVLTAKYLVDWAKQLGNIRMLKSEERYAALCRVDPDLVQRVPQKYLASFLGISESTISRARGK
jgi:CRP/FNR family transcriptional regulator, anaerobic regulatory protein